MESWVFLLVGSVGALGAAMALGTVAALFQLRRDGAMPGATDDTPPPDARQVALLWLRVAVGAVLTVVAVVVLRGRGLL